MPWLWWLMVFLILLLLLILLIPVTFHISFSYQGQTGRLELKIGVWPGLWYHKTASNLFKKKQQVFQKRAFYKKFMQWRFLYEAAYPALTLLLRHIKLRQARWRTTIGLADAFQTAMATGWLWGIKGFLFSALYRLAGSSSRHLPEMVIIPDFNTPTLATTFKCIFSLRMVYILLAGLKTAGNIYLFSRRSRQEKLNLRRMKTL